MAACKNFKNGLARLDAGLLVYSADVSKQPALQCIEHSAQLLFRCVQDLSHATSHTQLARPSKRCGELSYGRQYTSQKTEHKV